MDIVFLFYGLAFLLLGVVLLVLPRKGSRFELSTFIGWLTGFAFLHGALEWTDLWRVVRGDNPALATARPFILLISYVLLFEFGRRLVMASVQQAPAVLRKLFAPHVHLFILTAITAGSLFADQSLLNLGILSRYFYGFPGALMAGIGFVLYCRNRIHPVLGGEEFRPVGAACMLTGIGFSAYAFLGGLVVPHADWAPSVWLNQDTFFAAIGIPVQVFRAVCAVVVAISVAYILRIFQLESNHWLKEALDRVESTLGESERMRRQNQLLLESVAEGIFGVDTEGRCVFVNPSAEAMLGFTAKELLGQPMHALTHHSYPDGRPFPEAACPTSMTVRDGQTRHLQFDHFWRKDGSHFPVDFYTASIREGREIKGAVVVFQDISERKRIESELEGYRDHLEELVEQRTLQLQETEQKVRLILDASGDGLYGIDAQRRIIFINPTGNAMLGYAGDELIGRPVHAALHHTRIDGTYFPDEECPMLAALTQGEAVRNEDDLFWRADGSPLQVATATRPMVKNGRVVGAVVSFIDISQRKAFDVARNKALMEAERLARSKSEFLANMSHEIRTPLNAVLGMTHLLQRSAGLTPQQSERLQKIDAAGQHLLSIINAILDLSKIEAGKFQLVEEPVNIAAIVANVVSILQDRASAKGIAIHVQTAALPQHLRGDAVRIQQGLLNFAGNAVKFTAAGSITLRSLLEEETAQFVRVRLEVEDTGIGIPPESLVRLFNAFEQADGSSTRQYGGTGLGLAITRNLAQLMGGDTGVASTPGVGSRFWFTVKLAKGDPAQPTDQRVAAHGAEAQLASRYSGAAVLLVEDEPVNREVALSLLEEAGLQVDTAEDGLQALRLVEENEYDLILMDMQMPRMDGLEATRRIRELNQEKRIPILTMTANAFVDDKVRCLEAGMDDFITKPVTPELLYQTILKWLAKP